MYRERGDTANAVVYNDYNVLEPGSSLTGNAFLSFTIEDTIHVLDHKTMYGRTVCQKNEHDSLLPTGRT